MRLVFQTANVTGDAKNCIYPNRKEVCSAAELREAVRTDHVCAEYEGNYRSTENFRRSNVIVMDCDNDHTENEAEWITPEKLDEMMPDMSYAIAFSRSHMQKKNGKAPRPKFHVYFEIEETKDAAYYAALKNAIYRKYPFFDNNALDAARFIFGADTGEAIWHEGWLTIDSEVEITAADGEREPERQGNIIIEGTRNKTMSRFAGRVITRYGDTEKAREIFDDEAVKCEPPLETEELDSIWASAVRWYENKISRQDDYIPPDEYNTAEFQSLKPGDYSDIGEAKVLAREYGDELRYTDSTDLLRYNGIYWQESRQIGRGSDDGVSGPAAAGRKRPAGRGKTGADRQRRAAGGYHGGRENAQQSRFRSGPDHPAAGLSFRTAVVKELPLISLLGYALEHDDVIRMSNNAEEELQERMN